MFFLFIIVLFITVIYIFLFFAYSYYYNFIIFILLIWCNHFRLCFSKVHLERFCHFKVDLNINDGVIIIIICTQLFRWLHGHIVNSSKENSHWHQFKRSTSSKEHFKSIFVPREAAPIACTQDYVPLWIIKTAFHLVKCT